jgi:hypothetical protein
MTEGAENGDHAIVPLTNPMGDTLGSDCYEKYPT